MKIVNENLPTNEGNVEKAKRAEQRLPKKADPEAGDSIKAPGDQQVQQWIALNRSRITNAQTVVNAFRQVATWLERDNRREDSQQYLAELIEKTRSRGDKLLEPYRDELSRIMSQRDRKALQNLIRERNEEITVALGKGQTAQQNLLAMRGNLGEEELNRLLKNVVNDLKSAGKLDVNVARDSIIDLLG